MDRDELDFHLLRALEALLVEKHVSRAAQRLGASQPAMSRLLAKLRVIFDDDLLVRVGRQYELTARASGLLAPARQLLRELNDLQQPETFAAERVTEQITLASLDFELQLFTPLLLSRMAKLAPHASLRTVSFSHGDFRILEQSEIDFVITAFPSTGQHYRRRLLYTNEFACVMSKSLAERLNRELNLERFLELDHGLVSFEHRGVGLVDQELIKLGLKRKITVRVPGFSMVQDICACRDIIFTLPVRTAQIFKPSPKLVWLPSPLPIEASKTFLLWHPRNHRSSLHHWFRELIFACATQIESLRPPLTA